MLKAKKKETPASLGERIAAIRAECAEIIEHKAQELAIAAPGVPLAVIRQQLVFRGFGSCDCRAALRISEGD